MGTIGLEYYCLIVEVKEVKMKTNRIFSTQLNTDQPHPKKQTLSRQIENLREVLRRVPANNSSAVESLISKKLKAVK